MRKPKNAAQDERNELGTASEELPVKISRALAKGLDAWVLQQPDPKPSRAEAARLLLTKALREGGFLDGTPALEPGELNASNDA